MSTKAWFSSKAHLAWAWLSSEAHLAWAVLKPNPTTQIKVFLKSPFALIDYERKKMKISWGWKIKVKKNNNFVSFSLIYLGRKKENFLKYYFTFYHFLSSFVKKWCVSEFFIMMENWYLFLYFLQTKHVNIWKMYFSHTFFFFLTIERSPKDLWVWHMNIGFGLGVETDIHGLAIMSCSGPFLSRAWV